MWAINRKFILMHWGALHLLQHHFIELIHSSNMYYNVRPFVRHFDFNATHWKFHMVGLFGSMNVDSLTRNICDKEIHINRVGNLIYFIDSSHSPQLVFKIYATFSNHCIHFLLQLFFQWPPTCSIWNLMLN